MPLQASYLCAFSFLPSTILAWRLCELLCRSDGLVCIKNFSPYLSVYEGKSTGRIQSNIQRQAPSNYPLTVHTMFPTLSQLYIKTLVCNTVVKQYKTELIIRNNSTATAHHQTTFDHRS